jgi:ribosome maturation factor RimP
MGCAGPFFICGAEMRGGVDALEQLLAQTASGLGYELADFNFANGNKLLQVFIDKEHEASGNPNGGIGLEDCQRMSDQLQRVLEVEGVNYARLEVSSPGLDRRLRRAKDFARFAGFEAELRLRVQINGRRRLVGILGAMVGEQVQIDVEGVRFVTDLGNIERARLVPKI